MKRLFIIPLALLGFGLMSVPPAGAADLSYEKSTQLRRSGAIAPAAPIAGRRILHRRVYGTRMYESYPGYRYRYGYARPYGYRYRTYGYGMRYRYGDRYLERRGVIRDRDHLRDRDHMRNRDNIRDRDNVRDRGPDRDRATPPGQDRGAQPPREDRGTPRPTDRTDQPGSIRGRGSDNAPAARPDNAPRGGGNAPAVRERDRERRNPQ